VNISNYGVGQGQIWLDDIDCSGTERHLNECSHADWGIHNCEHYEDVAVSCFNYSDGDEQYFIIYCCAKYRSRFGASNNIYIIVADTNLVELECHFLLDKDKTYSNKTVIICWFSVACC